MTRRERRGLLIAALLVGLAIWLLTSGDNLAANHRRIEHGDATTYGPGYDGLLALPDGRGHRVRVCSSHSGEKRCITRTSNDAGPQGPGRIVDLDLTDFRYLCGCPDGDDWRAVGVIKASVEYLGAGSSRTPGPRPTLPPTDTER